MGQLSAKGTDVEDFHTRAALNQIGGKKLGVASVFEVELKVFGVQTKLPKGPAHLSGRCLIGGWTSPARVSSLVLEPEKTAIREIHRSFVELGVGDVAG